MSGTSQSVSEGSELLSRQQEPGPPATDPTSKTVMLRAERKDLVEIDEIHSRFCEEDIPSELRVKRRSNTYFGPKLVLTGDEEAYLLTAPGPDTQLLLWVANYFNGEQYGWDKLAEVTVRFSDTQPSYDLCPECGKPIQTIEHQRKAAFGRCPGPEV